jgi:hypothetical protein
MRFLIGKEFKFFNNPHFCASETINFLLLYNALSRVLDNSLFHHWNR